MIYFKNDYSEGAHPKVLEALIHTNNLSTVGYGEDEYCKEAIQDILKRVNKPVEVHFVSGGTQANLLVISHILKDYQAVIACNTGHINVHETGAIEYTGHKVLTCAGNDGKLSQEEIQEIVNAHTDEHMVQPKMVYISQTTEVGTYYSLEELKAISKVCKENDLYLYMDGARLASSLVLEDAPSLEDIASLVDVFYIGGTKCGALFGEAIVFSNVTLSKDFRYAIKQHGAMNAKGRLLGVQFHTLLQSTLYEEIGKYENDKADQLRNIFIEKGYKLYMPSLTNQVFVLMDDPTIHRLKENVYFEITGVYKNYKIVRFVCSWHTCDQDIQLLSKLL